MPTKPGSYPRQKGNNANAPQTLPRTDFLSEKSPSITQRTSLDLQLKEYLWNTNITAKSLANRNCKDYRNTLYGTTLSNLYQKHHGLYLDDSFPSHRKKSRRCTNLLKNTCNEEPSANPGAPMLLTSSS